MKSSTSSNNWPSDVSSEENNVNKHLSWRARFVEQTFHVHCGTLPAINSAVIAVLCCAVLCYVVCVLCCALSVFLPSGLSPCRAPTLRGHTWPPQDLSWTPALVPDPLPQTPPVPAPPVPDPPSPDSPNVALVFPSPAQNSTLFSPLWEVFSW